MARAPALAVDVLGPVTVRRDGAAVALRRPKERALLARLALATPRAVPIATLVQDLWPAEPPAHPVDTLRVHVANLRRALSGSDKVETAGGGYRLALPADAVDALRFEEAVAQALRVADPAARAAALQLALEIWGGSQDALVDVGLPFAEAERARLGELRVCAVESRIEAELGAGRAREVVGELEALCLRHPGREAFVGQLMTALYRSGRQSDALAAYRRGRDHLAELGLEPGERLRQLEHAVLTHALGPGPAPEDVRPLVRYAAVDGGRVAYQVVGVGDIDLLVLHGGFVPCDAMWDAPPLAAFLHRLGKRFRVLLCDRRGTGMSDPPAASIRYEHWVEDCLAVLDEVGSERALVFGHEHGGPAAVRLARRAPARIAGLVLHSVLSEPDDHPTRLARTDLMIDEGPVAGIDLLAATAPSAGRNPTLRSWLERAGQLGAGPARAKELHRLYRADDLAPMLPDLRVQVLVLHAARNRVCDVAHAYRIAQLVPGAQLVVLDSADHLFWLGDADAVLGEVERLADRAVPTAAPPSVLAAVAAVVGDDPDAAAGALSAAGAWAVATVAPDAVAAAFSSARTATAAVAEMCALRGWRGALDVGEVRPDGAATPSGPAVARCVRDARDAPGGTVVRSAAARAVLSGAARPE